MPPTVLLVESNLAYADRLKEDLNRLGYSVQLVADGLEALRWLRRSLPDLILADQAASWVDGFRLCRLVKFHKKQRRVPVVLMSGLPASDENRRLAETVKADAYVPKQPNPEAVLKAIQKLSPVKAP